MGVSLISLCIGSAGIPLDRILPLLFDNETVIERSILFDVRLPRIILGIAVGGALSLAGVVLQGMFRNPLVEPYTLGISGGAALGVSVFFVTGMQISSMLPLPLAGFIGAVMMIVLLYFLNQNKGRIDFNDMLLKGVMLSFISSSLIMLIMSLSRREDVHGIVFWIMGSLEEPNVSLVWFTLVAAFAVLIITYLFCLDLNALALGEEEALHLGVKVESVKIVLFVITALLTGLSVSVAGMIGFVGLVVPHFVRQMTGPDYRILLPASFLAGGSFLVLCDTIARTLISPVELPVGVITGILGGSFFIYALQKEKNGGR